MHVFYLKESKDLYIHVLDNRLDGLVVKAPASRAEDPGFEFRL